MTFFALLLVIYMAFFCFSSCLSPKDLTKKRQPTFAFFVSILRFRGLLGKVKLYRSLGIRNRKHSSMFCILKPHDQIIAPRRMKKVNLYLLQNDASIKDELYLFSEKSLLVTKGSSSWQRTSTNPLHSQSPQPNNAAGYLTTARDTNKCTPNKRFI